MTDHTPQPASTDPLERALAALSAPVNDDANLWQAALASRPQRESRVTWNRPVSLRKIAPYAAAAMIVLAAGVVLLPALGKARARMHPQVTSSAPSLVAESAIEYKMRSQPPATSGFAAPPPAAGSSPAPASTPVRQVVRKATIDLRVADVRSGFAKVAIIPNEALGEFVENSSLTGDDPNVRGTLTLRVVASRLSETLNQLRTLGAVASETSTGQDVTDSIVDLEARIRNEERIEREILALLDRRPDAPLTDILSVRNQLGEVRGRIESLKGQRERMGQLVSLATVVVSLQNDDQPIPAKAEGMGAYFATSMQQAWQSSLRTLSDSAAYLVRLFVGGLVWWIALALLIALLWRIVRFIAGKQASEPAPHA
ncbi:MAG TPA: DUF4349 domain-containing protein [Phycisphaerales bacterium]|nr:DUF4349 domain-containing protein [Phycisphaerales bacterium]